MVKAVGNWGLHDLVYYDAVAMRYKVFLGCEATLALV